MAVTPTGNIYKALTFDGQSSRTFGVYITGEAVYNAPAREVEMVSIPGRNGAFALDKGRFENIEVSYPAGIFADTEADFAEAVSDFRNYLCSRSGYVRLTDEYNPNEYRLAIYKSGLEVDPAQLRAGEFEIVFDCKPQRFLTSGETAISVESGDVVTNPTLFAAGPLLEVEGYGDINIGEKQITLYDEVMGNTLLRNATDTPNQFTSAVSINIHLDNVNALNTGDTIGANGTFSVALAFYKPVPRGYSVTSNWQSVYQSQWTEGTRQVSGVLCPTAIFNLEFQKGTASSFNNKSQRWVRTLSGSGSTISDNMAITLSYSYNGDSDLTFTITKIEGTSYDGPASIVAAVSDVYGYSSASVLGAPTYIDCDLGAAYKIESGEIVSLNPYIDLGSELPTLEPGANTVTFDNTITDLQIVPGWWRV